MRQQPGERMLFKRLIVCVELRDGRAVHGAASSTSPDSRDPAEQAVALEQAGADEIVFFDFSDTAEGRRALLDAVSRTAEQIFIPLTVGGGIHEVGDVDLALRAGADKVCINTAAVQRPAVLTEAALRFGSHSIVASIDTRVEKRSVENAMRSSVAAAGLVAAGQSTGEWYRVYTHSGSTPTMLDAIAWCKQCADLGAGELLLNSIDQDGQRAGYDLELTGRVVEAVNVPVIASGGAAGPEHIRDAFLLAGADAALTSGMRQDQAVEIEKVKRMLAEAGVPVRLQIDA